MHRAIAAFNKNMDQTDSQIELFDYLVREVQAPFDFNDILRAKIVYAVSAFDKLMHDLITIGMVEIFKGLRPATAKYLNEPIPIQIAQQLSSGSTPPPEIVFEDAIRTKLKILSFQDPSKISDGLSFIWDEKQKWQKIATALGKDDKTLRTTLRLIATRRNAIVHEADTDPISGEKLDIVRKEAVDIAQLLRAVGTEIYNKVKQPAAP